MNLCIRRAISTFTSAFAVIALATGCAELASASEANWPAFRGPTGMNATTSTGLPLTWGKDGKHILWKTPLPGQAEDGRKPDLNQSSPIVVDGRVFVTTCDWSADADPRAAAPDHRLTCYSLKDGKRLWSKSLKPGPWLLKDLRGGYAAPTPVADGKAIYALFGSAILHAVSHGGEPLWSRTLGDYEKFDVAIAAGPVLYKDTVILLADKTQGGSTLLAFDKATGKTVWEKKRPAMNFSHATPLVVNVQGKPQLIVSASEALQGVNPSNGEVIWQAAWGRKIWPVSGPTYADGLVFCHGGRSGHPGLVVDPTGQGDVTATHVKWKVPGMPQGMSSPVVVDGLVYRIVRPGLLRCMRLKDGEELYKQRLDGIDPDVTPIAAPGGKIYFASAGKSAVVQAGPKFKLLATSDLGDPSKASPAIAGDSFIFKGAKYLWRVGKKER